MPFGPYLVPSPPSRPSSLNGATSPSVPPSSRSTTGVLDVYGDPATAAVARPSVARVGAVVLAAGADPRHGGPKALIELDGQPLVERAVRTAHEGGCAPVLVVLGAAADRVRHRADLGSAIWVENQDWASGVGSSLRVGLVSLAATDAVAAMVLLVDMPGVTAAAVRRLARLAAPNVLAMARYGDRPGHPVLLGRDHWPEVTRLAVGDADVRAYLRRHWTVVRMVPCGDVADDTDLDVPGGS